MQYLYHEDPSPQALQAFSNAAAAVFSTHLVAPLDKDIACDLTIGVESGRDWLSNCKEVTHLMNQHTINVTADAQLWFLLKKRRFSVAHLIPKTSPHTARYPQLDMSPDYNNVDHHVRSFARRRLLQLDNTLTLPEAIKEWLSNALHWMNQASSMADLLRNRMCPLPAENTELNDITLRVFDAQQAILNATVRCDFDIRQDALQLKDCAFDTTPTNYNHDTRCDMNAHMSFPQDGAIWLSPNVANLYHTFLMVARQLVAPTPLPTLAPLVPTLQPTTLAPNNANPTTPQPTTLAPTPKPHTHTKTLPRHTATHSASHSLEAPARSTTTRLYWANQAANETWVAEVNQIDGRSINPRVFLRNIPNPNSIFVDEKYKKLYWANPAQKNIMVADLNNFTGIPFIANSRVFIPINSYGIYFDSDENMFYFQPVPKTLPMQLSCFQIDPTNPTFNPNFRNYSYPDSSGAYGMVVIGSEVYSFVLNGVAQIAISVINDTTSIVDDRYVLTNISNPDLSTPLYLVGVALDKMNNLMFWRDNRQAINVARYKPGTRPSFLTPFISFYTNVSGTYGGLSVPSY